MTPRVLRFPLRLDRRPCASSTPADVVQLDEVRAAREDDGSRLAGEVIAWALQAPASELATVRRLVVDELADVRRDLARAVLDEGRVDVLDAVRDLLAGVGAGGAA